MLQPALVVCVGSTESRRPAPSPTGQAQLRAPPRQGMSTPSSGCPGASTVHPGQEAPQGETSRARGQSALQPTSRVTLGKELGSSTRLRHHQPRSHSGLPHTSLCQGPSRTLPVRTLPLPQSGQQEIRAPDFSKRPSLALQAAQTPISSSTQSEEAFFPILSGWSLTGLALGSFTLKCA